MKTFPIPVGQALSAKALLCAWRSYRSGKRRRPEVAAVELDHERVVLDLADEILAGRYVHRPYRLLTVRDPKPRLIAVALVRDRVVHTAIYGALSPLFDASFIADSYACIPGRGSHQAVLRFLELFRRYRCVMHLDIRRYFPTIDHALLRALVVPRLRDGRWAGIIDTILTSGRRLYARADVRDFFQLPALDPHRPHGLPIGNLTSQWWGNLYLDGLDQHIKRSLRPGGYLRYMDDMTLFGDSAVDLRAMRQDISTWLQQERRLVLHENKGHVHPTSQPHIYLGYRVTQQGYDLGPKAVRRFRASLPGLLAGDPDTLARTLAAWRGAFRL